MATESMTPEGAQADLATENDDDLGFKPCSLCDDPEACAGWDCCQKPGDIGDEWED